MTTEAITRTEIFFLLSVYIGIPGLVLALVTGWVERKRPMAVRVRKVKP
jgi:hypothetical protein